MKQRFLNGKNCCLIMENGTLKDFGNGIKNTWKGIINSCKEEYFGIPMKNPIQLCSRTKMGLVGLIVGVGLMFGTIGTTTLGLTRGFDSYLKHEGQPKVIYLIDGKEVIERKFKTNEEMHQYLDSEQGKKEAAFYSAQNKH